VVVQWLWFATDERWTEANMKAILTAAVLVATVAPSTAQPVGEMTCAGKIWQPTQIGHGLYQCSIVSKAAKRKIFAVCKLGQRCTVRVKFAPRTDKEMEEYGGMVEIWDRDRVLGVRRGAADDTGEKASQR
jgi:hypothetical protein